MTDSVVVEGYARLRDGKKWKTRWLVLRKPSPVADCLVLLVFKDKADKAQGSRERASVTLEEICGVEAGQWHDGVAFTLAVLCLNQAALLGFDSKEALQAWDARLRYSLGEVHRFSVGVLPGTKLESGPATLHLCNNLLTLARDVPPVIIGHWNLPDLRRYGPVPNGFVFEGGSRCGYWAGVFLLASAESEQISFLFDCIVRGISPTRGPFGLRPVLPELSASQTNLEERLDHEAQELEKRLSLLSHQSSTASSSYCPSAGGDDRSISGSSDASDTSQSDGSIGSRAAVWTEPASNPSDGGGHHAAAKSASQSIEKLSVTQGGVERPAAKPPRQLQEIGRQSSSDSGIATASHSSYSGSFSSCTGSLDITSGEDFGSVLSLPPRLAQDLSPCTCATVPRHEYRAPTSLRYLYESPRSLLQEASGGAKDNEPSSSTEEAACLGLAADSAQEEDESGGATADGHSETTERPSTSEHSQIPSQEGRKSWLASSQQQDSCHTCSPLASASKTIVTICLVCGGFKGTQCIPASASVIPVIPDQSADKSPCRPCNAAKHYIAAWNILDKPSGSENTRGLEEPPVRRSDDSPLPRKGGDKLASLLADLLGFPNADRQLEAKSNRLNLYESMSPSLGNEPKSAPTGARTPASHDSGADDRGAVIYENCFKCRGEHCRPPPRVPPAAERRSGKVPASRPPTNGSRPFAGEEPDGGTAAGEDKRLNSKGERRRADPAYEIMESRPLERNLEILINAARCVPQAEEKSKYELMGSCGQKRFLQEDQGAAAASVPPPEAALPERPRGEGVTYVNIPVSPTSKKQLNYMELELQEPGAAAHAPPQRKACITSDESKVNGWCRARRTVRKWRSSTKYAQIDITATETAHKVGTQHALGRQEGLHALEQRRKGTPH
ncbi:protein Dok-7 isoform X2 [Gasterosteus aculeatus]